GPPGPGADGPPGPGADGPPGPPGLAEAKAIPRVRVIMVDFTGQTKIAEATAGAAA
ncbi:MAG: hypothetical protein JO037_11305, partial [Actinobacteria bacterium]|nr:hypothetical protein [Actinomycetota bacterium]